MQTDASPLPPIMIPAWVDGVLTPVEKLAAHQRGLRHLAVSVFVFRRGAVLVQQRAMCKYHTPGLWANTCCTHPEWDEAPMQCAHRRLNEELGITGLVMEHKGEVEYRADVGNGMIEHEVVQVYTAEASDEMPLSPNPDEVMATDWMTLEALSQAVTHAPERFTPWLRIYLSDHAAVIFR